MSPIGSPLIGTYDYRVVAISLLLTVITSYAALDVAGRLSAARGLARLAWLSGGAMALGIGLWTSQFMGMEAFHLPMPVRYYWPSVLFSLIAGIVAAAVGLFAASRNTLTTRAIILGSVVTGGALASLHYLGVTSRRLPAAAEVSQFWMSISIAAAITVSFIGIRFAFRFENRQRSGADRRRFSRSSLVHLWLPSTTWVLPALPYGLPLIGTGALR